ncbi:hypothetical protein GCM10010441_07690 [Kitasatospora paracochleata]|uniref:Uncharacterized protein n=1 Tax=Kitasatospora paracochleata TaxID=58354 RepID=A0ABT1J9M2_9ACTN|nr:hypothetical protein [Kitasatospora paracochleata]MCP2314152.1 hypothetical protein [Kitasatospora paracochleata]
MAIATAATVSVGIADTGTASAVDWGSDSATSAGGAWYQVYANGTQFGYHVNIGHTDERFYFAVTDVCGYERLWNWNDVTQSGANNYQDYMPCMIAAMKLFPTDGGSQDGRTVTR